MAPGQPFAQQSECPQLLQPLLSPQTLPETPVGRCSACRGRGGGPGRLPGCAAGHSCTSKSSRCSALRFTELNVLMLELNPNLHH